MTNHDNFVNEAVRTVELGHPDLYAYFDDLLQRVEREAIASYEAGQWKKYPENKPDKEGDYLVQTRDGLITHDEWSDEYRWKLEYDNENIAFHELPAPYQESEPAKFNDTTSEPLPNAYQEGCEK